MLAAIGSCRCSDSTTVQYRQYSQHRQGVGMIMHTTTAALDTYVRHKQLCGFLGVVLAYLGQMVGLYQGLSSDDRTKSRVTRP